MQDEAILRPVADYKLAVFDDEMLLYSRDKTQAVFLNATAALIWRLCDGQRSVATIRSLLQDAYPEAADEVAQDLQAALQHLLASAVLAHV